MSRKAPIPRELEPWIEARRRHRLSDAHVQMARELGMNPKELGKIDNHRQEPWKAPLPIFIETLYFERFRKERPDEIVPIEEVAAARIAAKRAKKRAEKAGKASRAAPPMAEAADGATVDEPARAATGAAS